MMTALQIRIAVIVLVSLSQEVTSSEGKRITEFNIKGGVFTIPVPGQLKFTWDNGRPQAYGTIDESGSIQSGLLNFPDDTQYQFYYYPSEQAIYWGGMKGETQNIWYGTNDSDPEVDAESDADEVDSDPEVDAESDADEVDTVLPSPACHVDNCALCKTTSAASCRQCEAGFRKIARGRECRSVTHENECQVENCVFCKRNDETRCRRCEEGFLRRRGGRKCKALPQCGVAGCRICHMRSRKKCKVCNSGFMKTHRGKSCQPRV